MVQIIRHYSFAPEKIKNGVLVLGNFDGIHKGHQKVISKAVDIAKKHKVPCSIMSFEPHPYQYFGSNNLPKFRITPFREKVRCLQAQGIDVIFAQRFDKEFASLTAKDFIKNVLVESIGAKYIVIGYDFIFGSKRSGNANTLKNNALKYGYEVIQLEVQKDEGGVYSSSRIRKEISTGQIVTANNVLGRSFFIEGRVRYGDQKAKHFGFPTANIKLKDHIRPAYGVYVVEVQIDNEVHLLPAVANLGKRPTVDGENEWLEVHLLDFEAPLYGKNLTVYFHDRLRTENKFNSIDELKNQVQMDITAAHSWFERRS